MSSVIQITQTHVTLSPDALARAAAASAKVVWHGDPKDPTTDLFRADGSYYGYSGAAPAKVEPSFQLDSSQLAQFHTLREQSLTQLRKQQADVLMRELDQQLTARFLHIPDSGKAELRSQMESWDELYPHAFTFNIDKQLGLLVAKNHPDAKIPLSSFPKDLHTATLQYLYQTLGIAAPLVLHDYFRGSMRLRIREPHLREPWTRYYSHVPFTASTRTYSEKFLEVVCLQLTRLVIAQACEQPGTGRTRDSWRKIVTTLPAPTESSVGGYADWILTLGARDLHELIWTTGHLLPSLLLRELQRRNLPAVDNRCLSAVLNRRQSESLPPIFRADLFEGPLDGSAEYDFSFAILGAQPGSDLPTHEFEPPPLLEQGSRSLPANTVFAVQTVSALQKQLSQFTYRPLPPNFLFDVSQQDSISSLRGWLFAQRVALFTLLPDAGNRARGVDAFQLLIAVAITTDSHVRQRLLMVLAQNKHRIDSLAVDTAVKWLNLHPLFTEQGSPSPQEIIQQICADADAIAAEAQSALQSRGANQEARRK